MGLINGGKSTVRDSLILDLDAANQKSWGGGNTWKDTTSQGNDLSLLNGLTHSQGPFPGAGYVTFDGTGDNIYAANSSDFDFGSGDFTLEMWILSRNVGITVVPFVKRNTTSTYSPIVAVQGTDASFIIYLSSNGTSWSMSGGSGITIGTMVVNKWHHVAIVRNGNIITGYFDGVGTQIANTSSAFTTNTHNFYIGGDATTNYLNGSVSNFRIVKGTALYTSNFTPPKGPLENISNTKLLTCQGSSITDASDSSHTINVSGNAAAVYNSRPYFHFDGTNHYLRDDTILDTFTATTDPWSVECWFNTDVNPSVFECMIGINYNNGAENTLLLGVRDVSGTCKVTFYYRNLEIGDFGTVTVGQWHHVVATHTSGSLKVYLDGTQIASNSNTVNQTLNTCAFLIGAELDTGSSFGNYFDGKISNVRMHSKTLSAAEVTQNFNALRARYGV